MSDHFRAVYARHADLYDQLVSREDYQGNLSRALMAIRPFDDLEVVEMGAGTGRLTRLLAPIARSVQAYDASQHMLKMAARRLQALGLTNCQTVVGDHRRLSVGNARADIVIEGWSFGHLVGWYPESWREEIGQAIAEMERVLRSGGVAIIIETLGTGTEKPMPPSQGLAVLYRWLETEHEFVSTWIRTDYRFESLHEAEALTRFFFGETLADRVGQEKLIVVPECTGIWWRAL